MFETSLEILRANHRHYKVNMEVDIKMLKDAFKKGRKRAIGDYEFVKTHKKYVKGRKATSSEVELAENWALMGAKMAWERRLEDISDAIELLEGINNEVNSGDEGKLQS